MKHNTIKFAEDLKVTLINRGAKISTIEIDNPTWNYLCSVLSTNNSRKMQIENSVLMNINEAWLREFIEKTYQENKQFYLEIKLYNFRAY